jgi:hypothetical protein
MGIGNIVGRLVVFIRKCLTVLVQITISVKTYVADNGFIFPVTKYDIERCNKVAGWLFG